MPNEQDQFLDELKQDGSPLDVLDAPLVPEGEKPEGDSEDDPEDPEKVAEDVKNRRHRRLEQKLQAERESNIALNARLQAIADAKKSTDTDAAADYLKDVERIYGTDSPEAIAATEIFKNSMKKLEDRAVERALETIREEQRQAQEEIQKQESTLDSMIEEIEDEHGVTLTKEQQKGFFKMVEKLSPKDADGNILSYADANGVWDIYQSQLKKKPDTRAKDLSARSMVHSGASPESKLQSDSTERFLRENGII